MKEIQSIINAYSAIDLHMNKAALATLVHIEGSSYRRMGARMLVLENGTYLGGISGGCLEGDALRKAQFAILQDKPSLVRYDTTQDDENQVGVGLGCNGIIDVLFTPLHANDKNNPVLQLSAIIESREPKMLATITSCDNQRELLSHSILYQNDLHFRNSFPVPSIAAMVLQEAKLLLRQHQSGSKIYHTPNGDFRVFIEVVMPVRRIIVYGGGFDVLPILKISKELGWQTFVIANLAKTHKILAQLADKLIDYRAVGELKVDRFTAILLMSHDYQTDFNNLDIALKSEAAYIGLLGPRKRSDKMFEFFERVGHPISEKDKERIYTPAGLDIGAGTPEEIALSIIAEIQSHFTGTTVRPLRTKKGTIHNH